MAFGKEEVYLRKIKAYLKAANEEAPGMDEAIIEDAGERLKAVLRKTFNTDRKGRKFKVYMSSAGRPTCQLLMARDNAKQEPKGPDFRMKMLIGDITEIALLAVMKGAGINITETNKRVELDADGVTMKGELDLTIDDETVWDVKSASRWAYENKWSKSEEEFQAGDDFGYCEQLYGYARADNKEPGGWFVLNKETGELLVRAAPKDQETKDKFHDSLVQNVFSVINPETEFARSFSDEPEYFRKEPTGNRILGFTCSFCDFKYSCWPNLQYKRSIPSKAKNPKRVYYTHIEESEDEGTVSES